MSGPIDTDGAAPHRPFVVSAPATSANLGPGFDCLGLALDLRNELRVEPGSGRVTVVGEGEGVVPADADNAVARAFDAVAPGVRAHWDLHCVNAVPLARGLGSSTAATVVGALAGLVAAGAGGDLDAVLELAATTDGHADNAAPCVFGGLRVARRDDDTWQHRALASPTALAPVVWIPARHVPTADARSALPATIDHAAGTRAVGSAAMLVAAFAEGDLDAAFRLVERDELHEPYRAHLVPELAAAREALALLGCAATISGAGPTVLAWSTSDRRDRAIAALAAVAPDGDRVHALDVSVRGAAVDYLP